MLEETLFDKALINPVRAGANTLYIVSGYATARMAVRHLSYAKSEFNKSLDIHLIVGMAIDGLEESNHAEFQKLERGDYGSDIKFECRYVITPPRVHSKIYAWFKDGDPVNGYIGSANYTQSAFSTTLRETLVDLDSNIARAYYDKISADTIGCQSTEVEASIPLYTAKEFRRRVEIAEAGISTIDATNSSETKNLTLLADATVPERSGLNWGQREGRNPNQAYINIPAEIGRSGFFPERGVQFTLHTDDGKSFICVRAQDNGKALESSLNNSLLGEYFRFRLGLPSGAKIERKHLDAYGRTNVDITKIDEEEYRMDFSVTG